MIRYFCTVTDRPGTWADLGFSYFLALRSLARIRVVPVGLLGRGMEVLSRPVAIVGGTEVTGRWEPYGEAFSTPMDEDFVNVICGDGAALTHHFTIDRWNVAITAVMLGELTAAQVTALRRYDRVLCPTQADVDALADHDIGATVVPPEEVALWECLKDLVCKTREIAND